MKYEVDGNTLGVEPRQSMRPRMTRFAIPIRVHMMGVLPITLQATEVTCRASIPVLPYLTITESESGELNPSGIVRSGY